MISDILAHDSPPVLMRIVSGVSLSPTNITFIITYFVPIVEHNGLVPASGGLDHVRSSETLITPLPWHSPSHGMKTCLPEVAGMRIETKMGGVTVPDSLPRSAAVPRIWEGVPRRNKNFTGRDDILAQLRRRLADKITAVLPSEESLPQALQGLGGVGKTAVAIEYAWRYRNEYDLVCWIRADQMPLVRSSLAGLAVAVGLEPSAAGIDLTTAGVLDALRRGEPYGSWCISPVLGSRTLAPPPCVPIQI